LLLKTDNEEILVNDTNVEHRDEYKCLGFVPCDGVVSTYTYLICHHMQAIWHFGCTLSELLCAINLKVGAKAELLHRQFYEAVLGEFLGVRNSNTNQKVLLGFERFPPESHF